MVAAPDARLDPAKFAGLAEGAAHVIRNAGGRASDGKMRIMEKQPTMLHQRTPLFIGFRRRHERDVQTLDDVDAVVVDLGEDDLLLETERVVALTVEGLAGDAAEVARAR